MLGFRPKACELLKVVTLPDCTWTNVWEPGSGDTGTDDAHRLPMPGSQFAVFAPGACQKVDNL